MPAFWLWKAFGAFGGSTAEGGEHETLECRTKDEGID